VERNRSTPIHLREDGITAINLQELYRFNSDRFIVFDFTPHKESNVSGADWEWWWLQQGHSFGAAVQAKTLDSDHEYGIDKTDSDDYPQIQKLVDYSFHYQVNALYCFYNYWNVLPQDLMDWPCRSFNNKPELWGCALADIKSISELHKQGRYSLRDVLPCCMPWHCIACCPGLFSAAESGPATRACGIARFLRHNRNPQVDDEERLNRDRLVDLPEPDTADELPVRIDQLLDSVTDGDGITRELVNDLWREEPPPNQVVLQGEVAEI
jgi:hypothetical protein